MQSKLQQLLKNSKNPKLLEEVFIFANDSYKGKLWLGRDYIDHAFRIAVMLADMKIDEITIAAALLHNVANTEDQKENTAKLKEVETKFGKEVAIIVQKTSELNKIYYSTKLDIKHTKALEKTKIENLRKMFFAIAKDLRVILIKLAARIDRMEHLHQASEEKQNLNALETLEIFVPIANRLGLGKIKRRLEDLSFEYLYPQELAKLKENIKAKYDERERYLKKYIPLIKKILKHEHIAFSAIDYRAKSYWSTYQKLQRHHMDFEKLYDLVALRIIVKDITACYKLLGVIHKNFQPISGQIQDYIAKPKENGYQSIHTTIFLEKNIFSEIQIRTEEMHKEAEFGICAHWAYKEKLDPRHKEHLAFSQKIPEILKTFHIDFFEDQIFTFTPKGDVIVLPKGSTSVDFAYAVHSDVGNHCESAKIDGKIIPLSQALKNGEIVEIITSKKKQPSQGWLQFVKTSIARTHIKKLTSIIINPLFSVPAYVSKKIFREPKKPVIKKEKEAEIFIAGQKGIAVNIAKCCLPDKGDPVKAYLTRHRAAVLHKVSCQNLEKLANYSPEKVIEATWHQD